MIDRNVERKYAYKNDGKNFEMHICADTDPMNPREEWDNAATMVCFHKRYKLGDANHGYNRENYNGWSMLAEAIQENEKPLAILPIYMLDHSGIAISTTSFNDIWDSGQIGFIFITKKKAQEEWPSLKDKDLYDQAMACLLREVETYDDYLRGNVHGFIEYEITTCDLGHRHVEETANSCWGFFGDIDECGVLDELPADATQIL